MNLPQQRPQHAPHYLTGLTETHVKENTSFSDIALKDIVTQNPLKSSNYNTQTISGQTDCQALKPELDFLKEKVSLLKNDILLKDAEIEKLKLNLVDAKTNMEQFSYVASHDLKEPLRMVTSYLCLLKNKFGYKLDDKANTYIDFAIDGGARLHTMFNGLLDLSQTGKADECKREMPIMEIIEEVQIDISKKIKDAKAQITVVGDMPVLKVFEKSVTKLVQHLICNAIKFSQPDKVPMIEISAKEKEKNWEFCVADNGIGVDANCYKQIFGVFAKLHNSTVYPGNGIGLAICKKAVEHHGGALWVTSEVNKGSKFFFILPK